MTPYLLLLPLFTSLFNRLGRGEAGVPRWVWYLVMTSVAAVICAPGLTATTLRYAGAWLVFFIGYAMAPWQAMFSAVYGWPPARKDGRYIQWMQNLAHWIQRRLPPIFYSDIYWEEFGVIYGTLRAMLMLPGILLLMYVSGSVTPVYGLLGLMMGVVYWLAGHLSRWELKTSQAGVFLAELCMGWWLGTYILIVAG